MFDHPFIFNPGSWLGEGKITINMVEEALVFTTHWSVQNRDFADHVICTQDIQVKGLADEMRNSLTFCNFHGKEFAVEMENENIGRIVGTGVSDEKMIAWEFRGNDSHFEGYETYLLQPDGTYLMKGEYISSDQFRTQIEAKLWPGGVNVEESESDGSQEEGGEEA